MGKSKVHKRGSAKPELNMTSLIDVTFLLIIFFMIVSKIVSEESVELIPPDLTDPKTREIDEIKSIKVSIEPVPYAPDQRKGNHLSWAGDAVSVWVGSQKFSIDDMDGVTAAVQSRVDSGPRNEKGESEMEILLRADSAAYYEAVQPVMAAITKAGVVTVHMVAYLPDKGPIGEGEFN